MGWIQEDGGTVVGGGQGLAAGGAVEICRRAASRRHGTSEWRREGRGLREKGWWAASGGEGPAEIWGASGEEVRCG
nr:unnamed protein product [Digitaria exilis]